MDENKPLLYRGSLYALALRQSGLKGGGGLIIAGVIAIPGVLATTVPGERVHTAVLVAAIYAAAAVLVLNSALIAAAEEIDNALHVELTKARMKLSEIEDAKERRGQLYDLYEEGRGILQGLNQPVFVALQYEQNVTNAVAWGKRLYDKLFEVDRSYLARFGPDLGSLHGPSGHDSGAVRGAFERKFDDNLGKLGWIIKESHQQMSP